MEKKRIAVLAVFSVLIASGFLFYLLVYHQVKIQGNVILENQTNNENATDSHGCLIHLGFTWNESQYSCVREWISTTQLSRYQRDFILGNLTNDSSSNNTNLNWTTDVVVTEHNSTNGTSNQTLNSSNTTSPNKNTLSNLINWSEVFS